MQDASHVRGEYPENLANSSEFQHLENITYLDYAGSGVYGKSQLDEYFKDLKKNLYGNPHSKNPCSARTDNAINQVRENVLNFFNVSSDNYSCIFTKNATAALELIGKNFCWTQNSQYVYLEDNHTSVVGIRKYAQAEHATVHCMAKADDAHDNGLIKHETYLYSGYKLLRIGGKELKMTSLKQNVTTDSKCVFAYPAQSNFNGQKYPLDWPKTLLPKISEYFKQDFNDDNVIHRWYIICDAASFVSTSHLNLKDHQLDFIPISFYKLFGFPTGVGALIVKKSVEDCLVKKYFGGGTVRGWLASEDFDLPRLTFHENFEDGTLPFLDIIAVQHGFNFYKKLNIHNMSLVQNYTFQLIKIMYDKMKKLKHYNDLALVDIYSNTNYDSSSAQGPIIAFNLRDDKGKYIGFNKVIELAGSHNINIRSGCFCNIGACTKFLNLPHDLLKITFQSGKHSCGDSVDLIEGKPIGALRVSLGYNSQMLDIEKFISFLETNFLVQEPVLNNKNLPPISTTIKLEEIYIYPVKSCRGMSVTSWPISRTGLLYDRYWMIADDKNVFMTLKRNTKLSLIQPNVDLQTGELTLQYMGQDLEIENFKCSFKTDVCDENNNIVSFKMFNEISRGINCGIEASEWLSKVIGTKCFLFQLVQNISGPRKNVSLVNKSQYLLVNQASIEFLWNTIKSMNDANGETVLNENILKHHFRANFIISGADAFSEDCWKKIYTNAIVFSIAEVCGRCSLISVDPFTGKRSNEPLKSLFVHLKRQALGIYLNCETNNEVIKTHCIMNVVQ